MVPRFVVPRDPDEPYRLKVFRGDAGVETLDEVTVWITIGCQAIEVGDDRFVLRANDEVKVPEEGLAPALSKRLQKAWDDQESVWVVLRSRDASSRDEKYRWFFKAQSFVWHEDTVNGHRFEAESRQEPVGVIPRFEEVLTTLGVEGVDRSPLRCEKWLAQLSAADVLQPRSVPSPDAVAADPEHVFATLDPSGVPIPVEDLARRVDRDVNSVRAALTNLAEQGRVEGVRGRSGGWRRDLGGEAREMVLAAIRRQRLTASGLRKATGLPDDEVQRILDRLVEDGHAQRTASGDYLTALPDRDYWVKQGTEETFALAERLLDWVSECNQEMAPNYSSTQYIGVLAQGTRRNLILLRPNRSHLSVRFRIQEDDLPRQRLEAAGVSIGRPSQDSFVAVKVTAEDMDHQETALRELIELAVRSKTSA